MSNRAELSRRALIKVIGGTGACLVLGAFSTVVSANPTPAAGPEPKGATKRAGKFFQPNAFIKIESDGTATITVKCPDMGQGVRTSIAMLVAEDLDLDWKNVRVLQATADPDRYGRAGVGGSATIRGMHNPLRQMGAKARLMLIAAAAKQWNVDPSTCTTENGHVLHAATHQSISYGELTSLAAGETMPPGDVKLKDAAEFKIIGKPTTRVDNPAVARGTAKYGLDSKTFGMVYAVLSRPPCSGASLKSFDEAAARKVSGVLDVVRLNGGIAVIGRHTWAALSGRNALNVQWDLGQSADLTSEKIRARLAAATIPPPEPPAGAKKVSATYDFPYLAHATMEPMNALAKVTDGACEVWAPTQQPDGARGQAARMLKMAPENVTVNVTLVGGGFGRRLANDYVVEAVSLSQMLKKPVQIVWSREDDMRHDFYRPAVHTSMEGVLDDHGNPLYWSHQCIQAEGSGGNFGGADIPYSIPSAHMRMAGVGVPIPTGPWRSVEHTYTIAADECFIDEMAHAAGKDAFEFRRDLLGTQSARLRNVLEIAAREGGWGKPLPKGHGRGIACFQGYGSYAAHVVELSVENGEIKLHRVTAVIDCGLAVNPKGVEAQMQGACVDGLSMALRAAITIDKGAPVESSWTDYQWMRMDAMPKIDVHIVPGGTEPGGMGEPGVPSVVPAVANAIFSVTGKRVRKFPINLDELA